MTRLALSRQVSQEFGWLKRDGGLKDMSCRVALLRKQADALVQLPAPILKELKAFLQKAYELFPQEIKEKYYEPIARTHPRRQGKPL